METYLIAIGAVYNTEYVTMEVNAQGPEALTFTFLDRGGEPLFNPITVSNLIDFIGEALGHWQLVNSSPTIAELEIKKACSYAWYNFEEQEW